MRAYATNNSQGLFGTESKTYASWRVWKGSTTQDVRFAPLPKRDAVRLYHKARKFERQTRQRGRQDGAIGRNGILVLHALIFDCLNFSSGRCDPSYETIARLANISIRSVARGLQALKASKVLNWIRRCYLGKDNLMRQDSNAYAVIPASQWAGFVDRDDVPPPRGSCGEHPPMPDTLARAADELRAGQPKTFLAVLDQAPAGTLESAIARLARARARNEKPSE